MNSAYRKYAQVPARSGHTGAEVARRILDDNGLADVRIETSRGTLSDHYDPRSHVLRLSPQVYGSNSISALGIAAHEVGHALQQAADYGPLVMRSTLVPMASLGSNLAWPIFILGLIFNIQPLLYVGIGAFALAVIFQLITLPVEFNASSRAMEQLETGGYLSDEEQPGAKRVLRAAAMTYVAAALASILQLARLILLGSSRRRD